MYLPILFDALRLATLSHKYLSWSERAFGSVAAFQLLFDFACFFDQFLRGRAIAVGPSLQFDPLQFEELFKWIHGLPFFNHSLTFSVRQG